MTSSTSGLVTTKEAYREVVVQRTASTKAKYADAIRPVYKATNAENVEHIGSCVLLEIDGIRCLMTAAHVIDEAHAASLFIGGRTKLVELGATFFATSKPRGQRSNDHYDFAVGRLTADVESQLQGLKYISKIEIAEHARATEGHVYTALGYPNAENDRVDQVRRSAYGFLLPCSGTTSPDSESLAKKMNLSGKDHFFIQYDQYLSLDQSGAIVSLHPGGMSGGALFDLGNVADPWSLARKDVCEARLVGLLIEYHDSYNAIVATAIGTIVEGITDQLSTSG